MKVYANCNTPQTLHLASEVTEAEREDKIIKQHKKLTQAEDAKPEYKTGSYRSYSAENICNSLP